MRNISSNLSDFINEMPDEKEVVGNKELLNRSEIPTILHEFETEIVLVMKFKGKRSRTIQDCRDEITRFEKFTEVNQVIQLNRNATIDDEKYQTKEYLAEFDIHFEQLNNYGNIAYLFDDLVKELVRITTQTKYVKCGVERAKEFFAEGKKYIYSLRTSCIRV